MGIAAAAASPSPFLEAVYAASEYTMTHLHPREEGRADKVKDEEEQPLVRPRRPRRRTAQSVAIPVYNMRGNVWGNSPCAVVPARLRVVPWGLREQVQVTSTYL